MSCDRGKVAWIEWHKVALVPIPISPYTGEEEGAALRSRVCPQIALDSLAQGTSARGLESVYTWKSGGNNG
jgi:hypothetical protein